jgi:hypothetical protein
VLVLAAVGAVVGRVLDSELDIGSVFTTRRR